jgi:gamma-glutamyltranspeptidase/glutathione hydrolase
MFAPHRARIIGTRHMAAAGQYLAAQAAFQILEAGGNAIDAGVAGGIALGVVQSEYVGFGGVAPIMIRLAETGEVVTISGLGPWPRATRLERFHQEYGGKIPKGILRTVVPAAPDAWITALRHWGTMSYGEVAAAALRFASEGFAMPSLMSEIIAKSEADYRLWEQNAAIYLPGGKLPRPGDLFVQSDLGRVIAHMIEEEKAAAAKGGREAGLEAARAAFYRGDIARAMVRFHQENGGWLAAEDLAEFKSDVAPALKVRFGALEYHACGPFCQGPLLAQTLVMLDGTDLAAMGHNSPAYIHHISEVLKLAYADRQRYLGDPKFNDVPIARLLDPAYNAERARLVDPQRATPGMPEAGDLRPSPVGNDPGELDTSYICAVDRHGNAFSATPSDGSAAAPVVPGLGFVPSPRGVQNWTDPKEPAVLGPGRRPRLTPNPGMVVKPGHWTMPIGSPGNDVQPQAMLQVMLNMELFGMTPQAAVEAPRFATFSYPRSSAPHGYDPGLMRLEGRIPAATLQAMKALGHDARAWPDWEWLAGAVCTIRADQKTGMMEGGADPRRPGAVAGW